MQKSLEAGPSHAPMVFRRSIARPCVLGFGFPATYGFFCRILKLQNFTPKVDGIGAIVHDFISVSDRQLQKSLEAGSDGIPQEHCRALCLGLGFWGVGLRVWGLWFGVWD